METPSDWQTYTLCVCHTHISFLLHTLPYNDRLLSFTRLKLFTVLADMFS